MNEDRIDVRLAKLADRMVREGRGDLGATKAEVFSKLNMVAQRKGYRPHKRHLWPLTIADTECLMGHE